MNNVEKPDYKKIPFIKGWNLSNYPFIEADFDAITEYQLYCKIVKYVNELIYNMDLTEKTVIELYNFVINYFDNLDVQDEVDHKLDEMAESGQLADIIALYLNSNAIMAYNTIADMKASTNLVDGSFARTYGKLSYNDGYGNYYKIRNILSTDVIDDFNIVSITSDPTIIAERIEDNYLQDVIDNITTIESNIEDLEDLIDTKEMKRNIILIGDSYAEGYNAPDSKGWGKYVIEYLAEVNIPAVETYEGGAGIVNVGNDGHTFLGLLENLSIEDKNSITDIVVAGGYNDNSYSISQIRNNISAFMNYAKENYPNAKVYFAMIGNNSGTDGASLIIRNNLLSYTLNGYRTCNEFGGIYIENSEIINRNYTLFYSDNVHLTDYSYMGKALFNAIMNQGVDVVYPEAFMSFPNTGLPGFDIQIMQHNNNIVIKAPINRISGLSATFNRYAIISSGIDTKYMRARFTDQRIVIPVDIDIWYNSGSTELYTMAYIILDLANLNCTLFTLERFENVTAVNIGAIYYVVDAETV